MSYNGSGTFNINTSGQPVVAGTVITASAFNALTTDLATGLTTAITKDGQTTTTARITFAQGVTSSLVTDSSSVSTGSIITAGGAGIAKNLYVGGIASFSAQPIFSSLTASSAVATDASKGLVSVTNTGTGNNVLATSPTITTPVISSIVNTGTLTLPTSTDTLVGRATTDTLTNKTLTTPVISSLSSASATALTLQSAGTTAITVSTAQNVGIGTTSPNKPLSVYGGDGYIQMLNASTGTGNTDGAFIGVEGGTTGLRIVNQENDAMSFHTNGLANERMRISSTGDVGIGTATPARKFHVRQGGVTTLANTNGSLFTDAGNAGVFVISVKSQGAKAASQDLASFESDLINRTRSVIYRTNIGLKKVAKIKDNRMKVY
jgi:hypothetical protein